MPEVLLERTNQACDIVNVKRGSAPREMSQRPSWKIPTPANRLRSFLTLLTNCYFLPHHQLPKHSMTKGEQAFASEDWHRNWFDFVDDKSESLCFKPARASLISVFKEIHSAFLLLSWFESNYKVDWEIVLRTSAGRLSDIESDCYLLASDKDSSNKSN